MRRRAGHDPFCTLVDRGSNSDARGHNVFHCVRESEIDGLRARMHTAQCVSVVAKLDMPGLDGTCIGMGMLYYYLHMFDVTYTP